MSVDVQVLVDATDITDHIVQADARFVSVAGGDPGECDFRVRDLGHIYDGDFFHTGKRVELLLNGTREWDGWITGVDHEYAFAVDDTTNAGTTARFWHITGNDRNLLWSRRIFYDTAAPLNVNVGEYIDEFDDVVVKDVLANFCDLNLDGLDLTSGITRVGSIDPFLDALKVGNLSEQMKQVMDRIILMNGAVYYIGPDRVVRYVDDVTATAPFALSDTPGDTKVGYREVRQLASADKMANDVLIWGYGMGSDQAVFARVTDDDSVTAHGRFQYGEQTPNLWHQESVEHRAETWVYGSPSHRRGHKDDVVQIELTIFEPGLQAGMGVDFECNSWDNRWDDIYPIRRLEMTFPTPHDVKYTAMLSHFMDEPWTAFEGPPPGNLPGGDYITETIPPLPPATSPWTDFVPDEFDLHGDATSVQALIAIVDMMDGLHHFTPVGSNQLESFVGTGTIPWFDTRCDGVLGGIYNWHHSEIWYRVLIDLPLDNFPDDYFDDTVQLDWWTIRIQFPEVVYNGAASGFTVRYLIAAKDPTAAMAGRQQGEGTLLGTIESTRVGVGPSTEVPEIGGYVLSGATLNEVYDNYADGPGDPNNDDKALWLILTPTWQSERHVGGDDYICLTSIAHPTDSGLGNSGDIFPTIAVDWLWNYTYYDEQQGEIQNQPQWDPITGLYYTQFPYVPGTLRVYVGGTVLTSSVTYEVSGFVGGAGADAMIAVATAQIGDAYQVGTEGPNIFDCSGLVYYSFLQSGQVNLIGGTRRRAVGYRNWFQAQGRYTTSRTTGMVRGSLVIYGADAHHIAIYIGNGRCISALNPTQGVVLHGIDSLSSSVDGFCLPEYGGSPTDVTDYGDGAETSPDLLTGIIADFAEVDPTVGSFRVFDQAALTQGMTVTYQPTGGAPLLEPGSPSGVIADHDGIVYRPREQRQLGWGTAYDGQNCGMTTAAMALDRHTLGAFSDIAGTPLDTPPNMRNFSGCVGDYFLYTRKGTNITDAQNAWSNGWNMTLSYPGPTSFDYFVTHLTAGRGAMVSGIYGSLPPSYRKDDFLGAHSLYINEQLSDGSFWGYDPLYRAPIIYPYDVLRDYMTAFTGSSQVVAAYTQLTPQVRLLA